MSAQSWKGRKILVTGGTGMIGQQLVKKLLQREAIVTVVSLDSAALAPLGCQFLRADLTNMDACLSVTQGIQDVFHLAGIKGSPAVAKSKPASFFYPTMAFNTHMLEAARRSGVERYLYTSSVGVYAPAEIFYEDDVWSTFPSNNDRFAGWAKRMGELQLDAYQIEYGWKNLYCVRPANVYGPYDNFDPQNAMVIPSLIRRATSGENPLNVWGDGSAIRDFIFAGDCADGMIQVVEQNVQGPVNLGSGAGTSIRELVETLCSLLPRAPKIVWDTAKPTGDLCRILDSARAKSFGINATTSLRDGLRQTLDWYLNNSKFAEERYNVFQEI